MTWVTLIYDRTSDDVITHTSKGFFNVVDWVRINGNSLHLEALANLLFDVNISLTSLTTPTITTIPSVADLNSFIANIETLRTGAAIPLNGGLVDLSTPYLSGQNVIAPDYIAVNNWESNLQLIKDFVIASAIYMVKCGVSNAGQNRTWQNRFVVPLSIGS